MSCRIVVEALSKVYRQTAAPDPLRGLRSLMSLAGVAGLDADRPDDRRKAALDDVSFTVEEGERIGVIGENGAGKSTLLQLLAGIASPSAGRIATDGKVHALLTLGLGLRDDLSGRENLYLDGEVQGRTRAELDPIIEEMIAYTELEEFVDRPVRTYSSGMKARLVFAGLVFIEPEILLIDEALSVGDLWFAKKAARTIRELCDRGRIVVIVSHAMEAIVELCSRCLWLENGRVVADGDPTEVTEAYLEHVHRRDEQEMIARFTGDIDAWAADASARIDGVRISAGDGGAPRTVLSPGDSVAIDLDLVIERNLDDPDLRLRIDRLDGLCVTDNRLSDSGVRVNGATGRTRVAARMTPLLLGPGFYKISAELWDGSDRIASRAAVFKVVVDRATVGGAPALTVPILVSSKRVA